MFRVTSLTSMDDRQLNRWIKRLVLILVAGTVLFVGFYVLDRWRPATTPIVDRRLSALEQAVRDKPDDIAARGQLADMYVAKGRFQEAIDQYNADPRRPARRRSWRPTVAPAPTWASSSTTWPPPTTRRSSTSPRTARWRTSTRCWRPSYYSLGSIAMKQGKPAEAIPSLEKALAIKRSDADALYLIGTAYVATGETDKAETALRGAVAFVPIGWSEPVRGARRRLHEGRQDRDGRVGRRDGRPGRRQARARRAAPPGDRRRRRRARRRDRPRASSTRRRATRPRRPSGTARPSRRTRTTPPPASA